MAEYQLTDPATGGIIIRTADSANIPPDLENRDYNGDAVRPGYLQWVEGGGVPDPYVPPEPAKRELTTEQALTFDHENRIRVLEGQPPIVLADFVDRLMPK